MTQEEMKKLRTFVKLRQQAKTNVPKVFVSWAGSKTTLGSISTQLWSLCQKIGILSKSGKTFYWNKIEKSVWTGAEEAKHKQAP